MTPEQKQTVENFGNAVAQMLASVHVINFKMDLNKLHVSIDVDAQELDIELLKSTQQEIEQITLDNNY